MSDSSNDHSSAPKHGDGDSNDSTTQGNGADAFKELANPPESMKPVVSEAPVKGWRLPKAIVIVGAVVLVAIGLVIGLLIGTLVNGQSSQQRPGGQGGPGGGYGNMMPGQGGEGGSGQMPSGAPSGAPNGNGPQQSGNNS